jgi:hypothetical protein
MVNTEYNPAVGVEEWSKMRVSLCLSSPNLPMDRQ